MAAKSPKDQIEKRQHGILSSKYYLDDFKTICQEYTQQYDKTEFADDGLIFKSCFYRIRDYRRIRRH